MDTEFLKRLSDDAATPSQDFKRRLKADLEARATIIPTQTSPRTLYDLSRLQLIMVSSVAAALIAALALFMVSQSQPEIVSHDKETTESHVVSAPGTNGQVIGATDTPDESAISSAQPQPATTSPAVATEDPAPVVTAELPVEAPQPDEESTIEVCRNEQVITIAKSDRLAADYDLPCADQSYQVSYWNIATDADFYLPFPELADATAVTNEIVFDWADDAPHPSIDSDMFVARFEKTIRTPAVGATIFLRANDGVRLYVDGSPLVNVWGDSADHTIRTKYTFTAGLHDIVLEYYDVAGPAYVELDISL